MYDVLCVCLLYKKKMVDARAITKKSHKSLHTYTNLKRCFFITEAYKILCINILNSSNTQVATPKPTLFNA